MPTGQGAKETIATTKSQDVTIDRTYRKYDYATIIVYAIIVVFGWLNIYAACYNESHNQVFDFSVQHGKQLIWIGVSLIAIIVILHSELRFFSNLSFVIYALAVALLVVTLFIGKTTNGGQSWIDLKIFRFQPSEFAKFATALALSKYVSRQDFDIRRLDSWLVMGVLIAIPAGLILLEHDTGSALVFACFLIPLIRFGLTPMILLVGVIVAALFMLTVAFPTMTGKIILLGVVLLLCVGYLFLWLNKRRTQDYLKTLGVFLLCAAFVFSVDYVFHKLDPHQQNRILVLIDPTLDLQGRGYNVHQSKIAIGSGGFIGNGFLKGTLTNANFVPEQETDFIFCTVGEEWGFLGGATLLALYLWMLVHLVNMAERQASPFGRFYGYSVSAVLFFHIMVNVGMVLGLIPCIGIPLPFFSYGGSSLLAFTIMLFIFIRLDAEHTSLI